MNFQTKNLVSFSVGTSLLIFQPIAKTIADTLNTSEIAPSDNNGADRNIFNIKPKNNITITGFEQRYRQFGTLVNTYKVWWRSGSVEGLNASSNGWTLFGTNASSFRGHISK